MASPVVWIRQLSGASLDLPHSDLVRYRCYKRKSVGAHPVHLQICVLLLRRAYTWYMVHGVCAGGGGGEQYGLQHLQDPALVFMNTKVWVLPSN